MQMMSCVYRLQVSRRMRCGELVTVLGNWARFVSDVLSPLLSLSH